MLSDYDKTVDTFPYWNYAAIQKLAFFFGQGRYL